MPAAIASVGMSSTADRQRTYQSRSAGLHGARAKPQLLITTDVTPCQHEQLPSGSQAICASMWVWPSMKPGETISPLASMVRLAAVATLPISTMRPHFVIPNVTYRRVDGFRVVRKSNDPRYLDHRSHGRAVNTKAQAKIKAVTRGYRQGCHHMADICDFGRRHGFIHARRRHLGLGGVDPILDDPDTE